MAVIVEKAIKGRIVKTVPLTKDLKDRMADHPEINWCFIMRDAAVKKLEEIEPKKKRVVKVLKKRR